MINGAAVNKKVMSLVNYKLVFFKNNKMTRISSYPFISENKMTMS